MTRREEIIEILGKKKESAQDLANYYKIELKEIIDDLEHIKLTVKNRLKVFPAQCKMCGFIFKERSRIKRPSRCPRCKHERIEAALFKIEKLLLLFVL